MAVFSYRIYGLVVHSELELPGLEGLDASDPAAASDAVIRRARPGEAELREGRDADERRSEMGGITLASGARGAHLRVRGVGSYAVARGAEITVRAEPGAKAADVRLWLLGSAFALLLFQRRLLPFHASAVELGGRAILFHGPSGAGKSTLAAFWGRNGRRVASDDIAPVDPLREPIAVQSGLGRCKLAPEAAYALCGDPSRLRAADGPRAKLEWPIGRVAESTLPLGAFVRLVPEPARERPELARLAGPAALAALAASTYRLRFIPTLGLERWHFASTLAIAKQAPLFEARYESGLSRLPALVEWLAEELSSWTR